MTAPKVGCHLIIFGQAGRDDLDGTLASVKAAGYDGVEAGMLCGGDAAEARRQAGDGIGPHPTLEVLAEAVLQLAPQGLVLEDLPRVEAVELVPGPVQQLDVALVLLTDRGEVTRWHGGEWFHNPSASRKSSRRL